MIDLIALALAIVLLLQLQRLRGVLSLAFSPLRARRIESPQLPAAFADLHTQAAQLLGDRGFDGPYWYLIEGESTAVVPAQPVAAWRKRDSGDVIWLYPPQSSERPNQLLMFAVRRLADGRHARTQANDCYGEVVANAQLLAQTVAAADVAALWQQHSRWCETLGAADSAAADDAALDAQAADLPNDAIKALLAAGKVYRDSNGLLRPRLRFALQILAALRRQPKSPKRAEAVPPERLVWLAQLLQRQLARPVPRRVQAGLFGLSTLLFLLAGGWFWGLRFAVVLFVAVFIHELGHYLAMRAFGYRNVQMLALPLVGGVTIGHEARPDAAQRAWMSLMGPLPGILIGWGLVLYLLFAAAGEGSLGGGLLTLAAGGGADSDLWLAAFVFLFLNYLNVLPVPPLDGAHVVQALLPTGSARLTAIFIVAAALIGAVVALWAGFTLLALLALLQLTTAAPRWQLAKVLLRLRDDPAMAPKRPAASRLLRVFETYDAVAGTATPATQRIGQALEATRALDIRPMRGLSRVAISAVYLFLLAGPVLAVAAAFWWQSHLGVLAETAVADAERWNERHARFADQAKTLELRVLLDDISQLSLVDGMDEAAGRGAMPVPADAAALATLETQLGAPLPEDLRAFYRLRDGDAQLYLRPLATLAAAPRLSAAQFDQLAYEEKIHFYRSGDLPEIALDRAQAQTLLLIGHDEELGESILYDMAATPLNAGVRVYRSDSETASVSADLRDWLQEGWIQRQMAAESQRAYAAQRAQEYQRLQGHSLQQLLAELPTASWWQKTLVAAEDAAAPASDAQLAAVAQRLGQRLPEDLAELYRWRNGDAPLLLLPLERWQSVAELAPTARERLGAGSAHRPAAEALALCIVIGGHGGGASVYPTDLWCPQAPPAQQFLSLRHDASWASATELLRDRIAIARAREAL